jgi:hypothetical protein
LLTLWPWVASLLESGKFIFELIQNGGIILAGPFGHWIYSSNLLRLLLVSVVLLGIHFIVCHWLLDAGLTTESETRGHLNFFFS